MNHIHQLTGDYRADNKCIHGDLYAAIIALPYRTIQQLAEQYSHDNLLVSRLTTIYNTRYPGAVVHFPDDKGLLMYIRDSGTISVENVCYVCASANHSDCLNYAMGVVEHKLEYSVAGIAAWNGHRECMAVALQYEDVPENYLLCKYACRSSSVACMNLACETYGLPVCDSPNMYRPITCIMHLLSLDIMLTPADIGKYWTKNHTEKNTLECMKLMFEKYGVRGIIQLTNTAVGQDYARCVKFAVESGVESHVHIDPIIRGRTRCVRYLNHKYKLDLMVHVGGQLPIDMISIVLSWLVHAVDN